MALQGHEIATILDTIEPKPSTLDNFLRGWCPPLLTFLEWLWPNPPRGLHPNLNRMLEALLAKPPGEIERMLADEVYFRNTLQIYPLPFRGEESKASWKSVVSTCNLEAENHSVRSPSHRIPPFSRKGAQAAAAQLGALTHDDENIPLLLITYTPPPPNVSSLASTLKDVIRWSPVWVPAAYVGLGYGVMTLNFLTVISSLIGAWFLIVPTFLATGFANSLLICDRVGKVHELPHELTRRDPHFFDPSAPYFMLNMLVLLAGSIFSFLFMLLPGGALVAQTLINGIERAGKLPDDADKNMAWVLLLICGFFLMSTVIMFFSKRLPGMLNNIFGEGIFRQNRINTIIELSVALALAGVFTWSILPNSRIAVASFLPWLYGDNPIIQGFLEMMAVLTNAIARLSTVAYGLRIPIETWPPTRRGLVVAFIALFSAGGGVAMAITKHTAPWQLVFLFLISGSTNYPLLREKIWKLKDTYLDQDVYYKECAELGSLYRHIAYQVQDRLGGGAPLVSLFNRLARIFEQIVTANPNPRPAPEARVSCWDLTTAATTFATTFCQRCCNQGRERAASRELGLLEAAQQAPA